MGIKGVNHGDDFRNRFTRAQSFDSTGLDAVMPVPPPRGLSATGGHSTNDYTENGDPYRAHIFTSPGQNLSISELGTPDIGITLDCLVVAGGGGGGYNIGGGGGAGGVRVMTDVPVTTGTFPVSVGNGGAGSVSSGAPNGTKGQPSIFAITPAGPFEAEGGGGGGGPPANNGVAGGSGGGGCGHGGSGTGGASNSAPDGKSPTVQGNAGGNGGPVGGGGGGGAGATGSPSTGDPGGPGGDGISNTFRTGSAIFYAGGGGGAGHGSGPGSGGNGGGGDGNPGGTDGGENTGGGGGGGYPASVSQAGGSGIVVIRYRLP